MAEGGLEQFKLKNYIKISKSFKEKSYNINPMISTMFADKIPGDSDSHTDTVVLKKWVNSKGASMSEFLRKHTSEDLHYDPDVYCTAKAAAIEMQKKFKRGVKNVIFPINRLIVKRQTGQLWPEDFNHWHSGAILIRRIDDTNQAYFYEPYAESSLSFVSSPRIVDELLNAFDYHGDVWVIRGTQKAYSATCMDHLANFIFTILMRDYPEEKNVSKKIRIRAPPRK